MISIENTLVSEDLISKEFVCNISKCKGVCCVEGEAGAPLEKRRSCFSSEKLSKIKPYLNDKGTQAIEEQGVFVKGWMEILKLPSRRVKNVPTRFFLKMEPLPVV